jgi:hypothetical protein
MHPLAGSATSLIRRSGVEKRSIENETENHG